MARVCARRAAGIVVGEYLHRRGITGLSSSIYHLLAIFNDLPEVDDAIKRVGKHFLMNVNHEHNLPVNTDLIQDAAWLKNVLLARQD